jgi:hypothetical protein
MLTALAQRAKNVYPFKLLLEDHADGVTLFNCETVDRSFLAIMYYDNEKCFVNWGCGLVV